MLHAKVPYSTSLFSIFVSNMKMFTLRSQLHLVNLTNPSSVNPSLTPKSYQKTVTLHKQTTLSLRRTPPLKLQDALSSKPAKTGELSRRMVMGAVSAGIVVFLMGINDDKALAFVPEGPLMEEFWDNVRRYALYALTVSTGALYAVFEPLYGLLKNPVSAILVLIILGGGFYIVSQVVSAMVGVTDFSYQYYY